MKSGTGVRAILRCCISNLRDCNVAVTDGEFINYDADMGAGAMIYKPSFIKIGSASQKLLGGNTHTRTHIYIYTQTARLSNKPTSIFSVRKVGL
jgi:hypothetical protein